MRDAGEEVVEAAIQSALDEGRAPTRSDIRRTARVVFNSGNNEWNTPAEYVELARSVLGVVDLDPATNGLAQQTVRARSFYTEDDDGMTKDWAGKVWMNPPYAQPLISDFADKLIAEIASGNVTEAIVLVNNSTDTSWFHKLEAKAAAICFTKGRIRFQSASGELGSPLQGQAFFYFGNDPERFAQVFNATGFVR